MKIRLLLWFLFILYTQSVTILGFEDFPTSKIEDFNLSKPRFVRDTGVNVTNRIYAETERVRLKGKQEIFDSIKGQKGKGNYGAGNDAHHPRSSNGAALSPAGPYYLISAAMLHVILALIGLSLPYFLIGF
ncbi:hypothetical protein CICLE_v10026745mg [Citrus x clementina]|uniref:Uncharacterized protein n=1 Tax=Citrus clementina TaxID=85681 RepID=V4SUR9_CITCL|nr:uncharacterized protein LOC18037510 isoform X2 [Citrus x clementina]XP_052300353.1 uncharacterized protein LOC102624851 isoform X2 [Citrus sinensis]ESR40901.1 hypothetical protein CICLE_v10026745mg [Citrus x clementina]